MKATDLMIGDWVEVTQEGEKHFAKVQMIDGYGDNATADECVCDAIYYSIDELQPIPLTKEILEKNGFHINGMPNSITSVKAIDDWSDDTYVWSRQETPDERMFVSVYMDDPYNFFVEVICQYCHADGIHVKYLHELQHALKLCGIDKEIIL